MTVSEWGEAMFTLNIQYRVNKNPDFPDVQVPDSSTCYPSLPIPSLTTTNLTNKIQNTNNIQSHLQLCPPLYHQPYFEKINQTSLFAPPKTSCSLWPSSPSRMLTSRTTLMHGTYNKIVLDCKLSGAKPSLPSYPELYCNCTVSLYIVKRCENC